MKRIQQNLEGWPGVITMMFLFAVIISSCVKDNQNNTVVNTPRAALEVFDASPDAPALDFYQNGDIVNAASIVYGGGIAFYPAFAGKSNVVLYQTGTTAKLASDSLNLQTNATYSLFIANLIAKPDFILLTDTIQQPAANMATMRFVDLSPDAPAVDFVIKGSAALCTNRAYKGYSSFVAVTPKSNDTLEVVQHGTTTILASLPTVNLETGGVYTAGLYGFANNTAYKLTIGVTQDTLYY
jgi:hypothetical protein